VGNINVPNVTIIGPRIYDITVNGTRIPFINTSSNDIRPITTPYIADRSWMNDVPAVQGLTFPVTTVVGTPVVDMPGCVKVHKENTKGNNNKMLVNDDPKGNTVLCDAGMPYYEPPDYDARSLSWETITVEQENEPDGVDTGDVDAPEPPGAPERPNTEEPDGDPPCPGPLAPRIGDVAQNQKEKVSGFELQRDPKNPDGVKICVTLYEDIGLTEQYLPSPQIVTTTAVIASVAASSALLAKPLADLLLRVVKPVVKKVVTKVNSILGKTTYRPSRSEIRADEYRKKKGLLPLKKKRPKKNPQK
tara:strand:+ start:1814 stop:2725 length:912 start_codon:yes stop_codon:yes gene_type:complete